MKFTELIHEFYFPLSHDVRCKVLSGARWLMGPMIVSRRQDVTKNKEIEVVKLASNVISIMKYFASNNFNVHL